MRAAEEDGMADEADITEDDRFYESLIKLSYIKVVYLFGET